MIQYKIVDLNNKHIVVRIHFCNILIHNNNINRKKIKNLETIHPES